MYTLTKLHGIGLGIGESGDGVDRNGGRAPCSAPSDLHCARAWRQELSLRSTTSRGIFDVHFSVEMLKTVPCAFLHAPRVVNPMWAMYGVYNVSLAHYRAV